MIGEFVTKNATEALKLASDALKTLKYSTGPIMVFEDKWMCEYYGSEEYTAIAITPSDKTMAFINHQTS